MAASTGDDVLPDTGRLQVGISGAGPAGLLLAIGLAQHGHSVTVLETLASPADRGTVNRDRSYPVDITARGMAALARFGVTADGSPLRRRTLPFYGHMTPWGPEALASAGLIGTRDDVVLGLLEFVGEHRAAWPGRVDVRHQVPVTGVDLAHKVILLEDGGRAGPFDLICACDGKRSRLRDSAAAQDPRLTVTARDGRAGEKLYKTFHVDDPGAVLEDGWLYMLGPPPHAVLARVPGGGGLGILPVPDRAARLPALRDRLPAIAPAISAAEAAAFEERPVSSAAGGYTASRLVAGSCLALVGDAACSPPPAGQGLNHALEAAAALVDAVAGAAPGAVAEALEGYERARRDDEAAYAFLGAEKGPWQALACAVGRLLGLYPGPAEMKETTAPYRQLTALHRVLGCA